MSRRGIRRLVIKPTVHCTANCSGCVSRRALHRSFDRKKCLSLKQWITVLHDAAGLGLTHLHISGGEPTLYPHLTELIKEGKRLGLQVRINSNGSLITRDLAEQLLDAGMDEICISLYSHQAEVHNAIRRNKNLWQKATEAIRILADLQQKHPDFFLGTMTIILKENYLFLDKLMELHHHLGSQQMGFSYLEGDFAGDYLLSEAEINEFRTVVIPRMRQYALNLDPGIRNRAIHKIAALYGKHLGSRQDLSRGIFWQKNHCKIPQTAGLIMANGDVHPCNIVEYTHEPVMGNVTDQSLHEIWQSEDWNEFRQRLHPNCAQCPVNIYSTVPLRPGGPDSGLLVSLYHSAAFSPLRPAADRLVSALKR